jgi:hypothetical protein
MYIAIVLFSALSVSFWGWRKGFLQLVLRLSSLLLAYALTWQEAPHLARYLADKGWLPGLLAWPVAGAVLFLGGSILFSIAARGLVSLMPEEWHAKGKMLGAISGVLLGAGLGLLMTWTAGALRDSWELRRVAPQQTAATNVEWEPSAVAQADHLVRDISGQAMAVLVQGALGDSPAAAVAAKWARQPLSMSGGLQHLASKPELRQLFQDPANYAVLVRGTNDEIQRLSSFQALVNDPQAIQFLSAAGLPGATPAQQSQALAGMLSRYAGNFEKLRGTPEFQSLAQDPELREKLQQGNLLALVTNDKMRRLTDMLVQGKLPDQLPAEQDEANSVEARELSASRPRRDSSAKPVSSKQEPSKPLYRWRDEKGRLHITEDKPPEDIKADVIQP